MPYVHGRRPMDCVAAAQLSAVSADAAITPGIRTCECPDGQVCDRCAPDAQMTDDADCSEPRVVLASLPNIESGSNPMRPVVGGEAIRVTEVVDDDETQSPSAGASEMAKLVDEATEPFKGW